MKTFLTTLAGVLLLASAGVEADLAAAREPGPALSPEASVSPSPGGRIYQVRVLLFELSRDCWEFGADGSFSSDALGAGSWELDSSGRVSARWVGATGSILIGSLFSGITFPGAGRALIAVGVYTLDPFQFPFVASGFENPSCVVGGAE